MRRYYFRYVLSLLLFGSNGIMASYIALSSTEIVFTRSLIGSLCLVIIFAVTRHKLQIGENKIHLLYLLISGAAMGASWMFVYEAYVWVGVSLATLAYYCGPVIVMMLSTRLFKEKMTTARISGFIVVLIGMVCVNSQAVSQDGSAWGLFCGIMSAIMYSLMVIFNKKAESITGLENSMIQLLIGFITVFIFLGLSQGISIHVESGSLLPILMLGIVNTGISCFLYFSSISQLPVQTVAVCGYLEPLSALVLSAVVLRETLSPLQIAGALLILGGAVYAEVNPTLYHKASQ